MLQDSDVKKIVHAHKVTEGMRSFLETFPPTRVIGTKEIKGQKNATGLRKILQVGVLKEELAKPDWKSILSGDATM